MPKSELSLGQRRQRVVVGVARFESAGQLRIVGQRQAEEVRLHRHLGDRHFEPGRALDADLAAAEFEIVRAGFEHVAGHALEFFLDDRGGAGDRPGDHDRVAAAARPGAREGRDRCPNRSTLMSAGSMLELLGEHHGGHRLGAVAPARRMQRDHRLAGRVDLDRGAFRRAGQREARLAVEHPEFGRAEHALFLAAGDADADISPLRARTPAASRASFRSRASRSAMSSAPG